LFDIIKTRNAAANVAVVEGLIRAKTTYIP